jgi:GNAT superfamily N-acetyltransferase
MIRIQTHSGDRTELLPLFRLADESESEIQSYCMLGEVLVALDGDMIVGMAQVEKDGDTVQIISLAVAEARQRQGIGSQLITVAQQYCRLVGAIRLIVCTGAWEADNISFYSRRGFRLFHVEQGFFTPAKGYAELGDQVQFEIEV